jgi:hypothetical protein
VTQAQHTAGQSLQEEESVGNTDLHPDGLKTPARRGFPQRKRGFRLGGLRGLRIQRLLTPPRDFRCCTTGIRYADPLRTRQINALALIPT